MNYFYKMIKVSVVAFSCAFILNACTTNSASVYTSSEAQKAQAVRVGTVMALTPVLIQGEDKPLITIAGTAVGGIAGSTIGKGRGSAVGAVVGGVLGGLATQAATKQVNNQKGVEVIVQLDGRSDTISIIQRDDAPLTIGQKVRVVSGGGKDRVLPF